MNVDLDVASAATVGFLCRPIRTVIGPDASARCPEAAAATAPPRSGRRRRTRHPGIDLHASLSGECVPQHATMAGQRLGIELRPGGVTDA
jgi:hypothetical protein